MKLSLLALYVAASASSASAFTVQQHSGASSALFSSPQGFEQSRSFGQPGLGGTQQQQYQSDGDGLTSSPYSQGGTSVSNGRPGFANGVNMDGGFQQVDQREMMGAGNSNAPPTPVDLTPLTVQGGSLRTWSSSNTYMERVQVVLETEGRPLNADVDLWQGPDNTPQKMRVYVEDGRERPFNVIIETPRAQNAISIRNTGQMEFPLRATVNPEAQGVDVDALVSDSEGSMPETIQGGALKTYSFAPNVASVLIVLRTDGRPLNARVELLQGPNNNKQVVELYAEDGLDRPFYSIVDTPGVGNVVRVLNTAPMEFPMAARVEPYMLSEESDVPAVVVTSGMSGYGPMF